MVDGKPDIARHAAALRAFADGSGGGEADRWRMNACAEAMERGDARRLSDELHRADTWLRDQILDFVHPALWTGLGYDPIHLDRSLREYRERFGPAEEEPAPGRGM